MLATEKLGANGNSRTQSEIETRARPDAASVQLFAQLGAGEAVVTYADDGKMDVLPMQAASVATSWLQGRRQYRNEPLRYVLADVARYTEQPIEIADAATGDLKFTGTLILQNSGAWLKGLSIALPVTTGVREDGTLLVKLRESKRTGAAR
jgi:ferric-dicitrate binding protein FerR (iron transport regulator)